MDLLPRKHFAYLNLPGITKLKNRPRLYSATTVIMWRARKIVYSSQYNWNTNQQGLKMSKHWKEE